MMFGLEHLRPSTTRQWARASVERSADIDTGCCSGCTPATALVRRGVGSESMRAAGRLQRDEGADAHVLFFAAHRRRHSSGTAVQLARLALGAVREAV